MEEKWIRVRRSGWVWGPSLAAGGPREKATQPVENPPVPDRTEAGVATTIAEAAQTERVIVGTADAGLRVSPQGDTVAVLWSGADLEILDRRRGWARVRLEGGVPAEEISPADPDSTLADLSVTDLRANPDQFRGRRVRWSVQFVSLEKAEAVRRDFYEGEPFILARAPDPSQGFVYIAVPAPLLSEVERFRGLEIIEVLASVRTGRSTLMGVPILDLLAVY